MTHPRTTIPAPAAPPDTSVFDVCGVPVCSTSMQQLLDDYDEGLLIFHNLDTINKASRDPRFREVCRRADHAVIDGQVLRVLIGTLWRASTAKVSGSDFLPAFCSRQAADPDVRLFLLGAGPGVAERARQHLNAAAGREVVIGAHSPSFHLLDDPRESAEVVELVRASGATALAVGLGAPKQEVWLAHHRHLMPEVRRFMAVGATFDFEAGQVRRAPKILSALGFEWLFRLLMEPRRLWRRYLLEGPQVVVRMARYRAHHASVA